MATKRKKRKKLTGTVQKIIKPVGPGEPEKAEISVHEAEDLYREIRIENTLTTEKRRERATQGGRDGGPDRGSTFECHDQKAGVIWESPRVQVPLARGSHPQLVAARDQEI